MFSSYLLKGAETMKKLSLTLIICSNFLFADYLLVPQNACVKDYYFQGGYLYYQYSHYSVWQQTSDKSLGDKFINGYEYNATTNECTPEASNNTLGLSNEDFNYLNAVVGLMIFGLVIIGLFL